MSAWEQHLERLVNGTVQLGPRHWRWLWESKAGRTIIARLAITAGAGWAMYRLAGQWPWLWAVAVLLVLAKGYLSMADGEQPEDAEPEPEPVAFDPVWTREAMRTELLHSLRTLADGYANVHLSRVHSEWIDRGLIDESRELTEFRTFAESLGIPVRDSVKAGGSTRIGVRIADLPEPDPQPAAETAPPAVPDDLLQDW